MGRCARAAWDHAVEQHRASTVSRPGVTTGHLLLGVLQHDTCAGGLILARMQLDLKLAYMTTEFVLLHGRRQAASAESTVDWAGVPHSPAAKQVLDLALEEANLYSATYPIGTEHILLGLLRVPEGTGYRLLHHFGLDVHAVRAARDQLWDLLRGPE
jgi:ATP-dependent Clp protease ATP-binding subunit ClpA